MNIKTIKSAFFPTYTFKSHNKNYVISFVNGELKVTSWID